MAADQIAYTAQEISPAVPLWLNKGDNAWQMTASTLVGMQSMPGLVILYASIVKKKWAVNSAFMALYAFAAVLLCWVLLCYRMAFGDELLPFWGKGAPALGHGYLIGRAKVPERFDTEPYYPMATLVYFHFTFAAISLILLAGSVLGRMNIRAWMAFVPLWHLVLNTNVSAATSLLVWTCLDVIFFGKPSVIGDVQGMITGLACITPGAGLVQTWGAIIVGMLSGSIPWVSMMVLHKKCK